MGEHYKSCQLLGAYRCVKQEPPSGTPNWRLYFESDHYPSPAGIELLDGVANAVTGALGVIESGRIGASFILVVQDGVDTKSVERRFAAALRRRAFSTIQLEAYRSEPTSFASDDFAKKLKEAMATPSSAANDY